MFRHAFLFGLLLAATPALGSAQAPRPAPKPPVKPAAKPAPAKPVAATPSGAFNAQDPASLIALVATMDAKAEIMRSTDTEVFLKVSTPSFAFNVQYTGCDARGRSCQGFAFSTHSDTQKTNLAQLNAFNQTSITCRVFQDRVGKPHVMYTALLSRADTREEMRSHIGVWQGCLGTFGVFLSDPVGYLASAP